MKNVKIISQVEGVRGCHSSIRSILFFVCCSKAFKVIASNGNAFVHLELYEKTENGEFALIAADDEIEGFSFIDYQETEKVRIAANWNNIQHAVDLVKKIAKALA